MFDYQEALCLAKKCRRVQRANWGNRYLIWAFGKWWAYENNEYRSQIGVSAHDMDALDWQEYSSEQTIELDDIAP